eukprot:gene40495-64408_t
MKTFLHQVDAFLRNANILHRNRAKFDKCTIAVRERRMALTAAEVLKMVQDNEVKFVDFRFADTRGKEQHVTVPVSHFDIDKFESGHAFDGSSIAGWKAINESDMAL